MIELRCPACRHLVKLDESFAGRRVVCVGCAKEFTVPDRQQLAATTAGHAAPPARAPRSARAARPRPAQPEQTLLDTARRHRELVVGGLIVAVLGLAAFVIYSSIPSGSREELPDAVAQTNRRDDSPRDDRADSRSSRDAVQSADPTRDERPARDAKAVASTTVAPGETAAPLTQTPKPRPQTPKSNSGKAKPAAAQPPPSDRPDVPQASSAGPLLSLNRGSTQGILLRESDELNDWLAVSHDAEIPAGTRIAVPGPFDARLDVGTLYTLRLLGGTVAGLIEPSDDVPLGIELERGRLIVDGRRDGELPGAVLSLAVRGERWRAELLSPDTVLGVEILPRRSERFEQDFGDDVYEGGILVAKGSVRVVDAAGRTRVVAGNSWLSLARRDRVEARTAARTPNGTPATLVDNEQPERRLPEPQYRPLPGWLDLDKLSVGPRQSPDAVLFEQLFDRQQPLAKAIEPLLASSDDRAVALAVETQALLRRRSALVEALAKATHADVHRAAIDGLRDQMPATREGRGKFRQELSEAFGKGADAVYALLWGYPDEEVRNNQFTCFQLVSWLMDEQLVVRELAWAEITRHADARYAYNPAAPERVRRRAARQWQMHVQKTGTILGEEMR